MSWQSFLNDTVKRMAVWTELVQGRITYRTEPSPFAIESLNRQNEPMLTFDGINQGTVTFLAHAFTLDQVRTTYLFQVLPDAEVRQLYHALHT